MMFLVTMMSVPCACRTECTVDVAVQPVAGLDRLEELQLLVDLDDLRVRDADVGVREERRLRLVAEDRDEGQRRRQRLVAEIRGGGLVVK